MRKENKPYSLLKLLTQIESAWTKHFVFPQFDSVGEDTRILKPRTIEVNGGPITLGKHVHIMSLKDAPVRLNIWPHGVGNGKISIGDYSIINPGCRLTSASGITLGHSVMLAMGVYIFDSDWHDINHRIYPPSNDKPVVIKNNAWIGDNATICKGVTIGENSVVGAGSVVTKDVSDNVVVAGNPARFIRKIDVDQGVTMRRDLFTSSKPYHEFADEFLKESSASNTYTSWLRSQLFPTRKD